MNPRLNKKVKKFLDAYFKGTSASSPEAHHALMFILKGALTDANFHSTSKKVDKLFPKAKWYIESSTFDFPTPFFPTKQFIGAEKLNDSEDKFL